MRLVAAVCQENCFTSFPASSQLTASDFCKTSTEKVPGVDTLEETTLCTSVCIKLPSTGNLKACLICQRYPRDPHATIREANAAHPGFSLEGIFDVGGILKPLLQGHLPQERRAVAAHRPRPRQGEKPHTWNAQDLMRGQRLGLFKDQGFRRKELRL